MGGTNAEADTTVSWRWRLTEVGVTGGAGDALGCLRLLPDEGQACVSYHPVQERSIRKFSGLRVTLAHASPKFIWVTQDRPATAD